MRAGIYSCMFMRIDRWLWELFQYVHPFFNTTSRVESSSFFENIDRRPPTLLKNFTLLQTVPGFLESYPAYLYILPHADSNKLTLITGSPLESYEISPVSFFDGQAEGIKLVSRIGRTIRDAGFWKSVPSTPLSSPISRFVRTPEGQCVGVVREGGIELQLVSERGTQFVWKERLAGADGLIILDKGA